ncbi:hypothetical protein ACFVVX_16140 [Kitasatospora sp. NPDC058170]|uniref:hypothetical protein n=1 Tax=Kitasatospora sp. NPDC058170 TaxID=3346364 RepID=UPI0036DC26C2
MTMLEEGAVRALAGALRDIQQLESTDRRAELVHTIRQTPGVQDFEVVPDNATYTHLTRIARSCIQHRNAPAARRALHEEARRVAGGQRAVSWLGFFNAVLDSGHPESFRIWLLDVGGRLRTAGWGSSRSPGEQDPLGEFTRLVSEEDPARIRAFCAAIGLVGEGDGGGITIEVSPAEEPGPQPEPGRSRRWVLLSTAVAVALVVTAWAVSQSGEDRPAVSVPVGWDSTELRPDGSATATVAVPDGRTRLVLPLDLSDPNPDSGACSGEVELSLDGQGTTTRGLKEVVRTAVPAHQTTLTLKLTLRAAPGCRFQLNTTAVGFEG